MSFQAFEEVCTHATHVTGEAMTVLMYLAMRADENYQCSPKIKVISSQTHISEKSVSKILRRLEQANVLSTDFGKGAGNASIYTINPFGAPYILFRGALLTSFEIERIKQIEAEQERLERLYHRGNDMRAIYAERQTLRKEWTDIFLNSRDRDELKIGTDY